ncbi:MAG: hypothetical protein ACK55O_07625 [Phycisphaerales bacterium]|jgi:hypothetical protein|nr:hypothetical protein [Phycisphaeraceae bacterium]
MSVVPNKPAEAYDFAVARQTIWSGIPTQIGLTAADAAAMADSTDAFAQAFDAAVKARAASKAATEALAQATRTMRTRIADNVQKIRIFAESTNNPTVYSLAQIPAPARPSPLPAPDQPREIEAVLNAIGTLTLRFRTGRNNPGTAFLISRKLASETAFTFIGTADVTRSPIKSFTDTTLPPGSNNVQYIITGQRGSVRGASSPVFTVVIGGVGGAPGTATVRIAA